MRTTRASSAAKGETSKSVAPVTKETKPTKTKRSDESKDEKSLSPSTKKSKTMADSKHWAIGDEVPNLSLRNQRDEVVSLHSLVKDQGIIVFLYPKANTPGCTKQACGFRDEHAKITKAGYAVYGLSADSPRSQSTWQSKYDLPYDLLCDPDFVFIKAMGAHKAPKSIKRSHIVIGKGGIIEDLHIQVSPLDSVSLAVGKAVSKL